jgi:leucyl-tRNA synthetase
MRKEFLYFYPLDSRNSGRDLVPNHLSFFIFNHAVLFPKQLWPKQIVVTGSVLMEGKKMSKSLGNIIPLKGAIKEFGADPFRLTILSSAELLQDADFSPTLARAMKERLERLYTSALDTKDETAHTESIPDRWLLSRLQEHIRSTTKAMDSLRFREAIQNIIYLLDQDMQWYVKRTDPTGRTGQSSVLKKVLETRILFLAPFAPHICEELWEIVGGEGLVSDSKWPEYDETEIDHNILLGEELIASVKSDSINIQNATSLKPGRIIFYVASRWKWEIYLKALKRAEEGNLKLSVIMKEAMQDDNLKGEGKRVASFVQEIVKDLTRTSEETIKRRLAFGPLQEFKTIADAKAFLAKELKAEIEVYEEDSLAKIDPKDRARLAEPYRPAIYLE